MIRPTDRDDEIGIAEQALAQMESILSDELRQKRRLAELGLAVSKINHELRNMLTTAQLLTDRLERVNDDTVQRVAPRLVATLDRAINFCQATLAYGRATEPLPQRRMVPLSADRRRACRADRARQRRFDLLRGEARRRPHGRRRPRPAEPRPRQPRPQRRPGAQPSRRDRGLAADRRRRQARGRPSLDHRRGQRSRHPGPRRGEPLLRLPGRLPQAAPVSASQSQPSWYGFMAARSRSRKPPSAPLPRRHSRTAAKASAGERRDNFIATRGEGCQAPPDTISHLPPAKTASIKHPPISARSSAG